MKKPSKSDAEVGPAVVSEPSPDADEMRYAEGTNVVLLDPDVAAAFPDAQSVNAALRTLADIAHQRVKGRAPAA